MMRLKVFKYIFLFYSFGINAQNTISGFVTDKIYNSPIEGVQIINPINGNFLTITNNEGYYYYSTQFDSLELLLIHESYITTRKKISFKDNNDILINVGLYLKSIDLDEIELLDERNNIFQLEYLTDVYENSIFSGKKNELIISESKSGKSINNARQMYNQTVSLNIYQTDDAGLQLNIGGRGLDPRRTANFNLRQNNYDISADPLGYPESYYTPPFECLENIQLIRGAASLQYGTQFGGLINFLIKKPNPYKSIEVLQRNSIGSNSLFTNFTSLSGTTNKLGYYTFYNKKKGSGFRPNSDFDSDNLYAFFSYQLSDKIKISSELTYLQYLAQQPGGLTDLMFQSDMFQSNRERNWFQVNWLLYNFQGFYSFSEKSNFSFNFFALKASRYALGFRTNRVDQIDSFSERDLIKTRFNNFGFELKFLHEYNFLNIKNILLLGSKFYSGKNLTKQGPGSDGFGSNFQFQLDLYPDYESQSKYSNPNSNFAFFGEQIIYLNRKMSLTPGFRFEYINTASEGYYRNINVDGAGNVILNELISTESLKERSFLLYGLGYSFKFSNWSEFYSNFSKNYRAVTFADINIINPNFIINPNISDENGYTLDFGLRGNFNEFIFYDFSSFYLFYNDRIGFVQKAFLDGSVKNEKGNVGNALIYGQEYLLNFNLKKMFDLQVSNFNYFINYSLTNSEYIESEENGIVGNDVEFIPKSNLKTGLQLGFANFKTTLQYTFMSEQFTDATNSVESDLSGVIGQIPKYNVLDLSFSYIFNNITLELGINNLLDEYYFTNRATGYPGPGIIPSPNRNFYFLLEYKF